MPTERTHITWSIEKDNKCPVCGDAPRLIVAPPHWRDANDSDDYEIDEEVSGHFCPTCRLLISLSLNTFV